MSSNRTRQLRDGERAHTHGEYNSRNKNFELKWNGIEHFTKGKKIMEAEIDGFESDTQLRLNYTITGQYWFISLGHYMDMFSELQIATSFSLSIRFTFYVFERSFSFNQLAGGNFARCWFEFEFELSFRQAQFSTSIVYVSFHLDRNKMSSSDRLLTGTERPLRAKTIRMALKM